MTSVADIIADAYRESNLIPMGDAPGDDQTEEAFRRLSSIVASVMGNEFGENLNPFPLGQGNIDSPTGYPWWSNELPGNVFVPPNFRVMCNLTGPGTINLTPRPHDGARMGVVDVSGNFATNNLTINGNGRNIEGSDSLVLNTDDTVREWLYREDLGNWVVVTPLAEDGDMPFPSEFDDMFVIMLAMRLNPRYGRTVDGQSQAALARSRKQFTARYSQSNTQMPVEDALLYMTNYYRFYGRPYNGIYGDPNAYFNSGFNP